MKDDVLKNSGTATIIRRTNDRSESATETNYNQIIFERAEYGF